MVSVTAKKGNINYQSLYGGMPDAARVYEFSQQSRGDQSGRFYHLQYQPKGHPSYYVYNTLQFKTPGDHAQDATQPPNSSIKTHR